MKRFVNKVFKTLRTFLLLGLGLSSSSVSSASALFSASSDFSDPPRRSFFRTAFSNSWTSSGNYELSGIRLISEGYSRNSCSNSRFAFIAFACSKLMRPVIPSSCKISLSFLICCEGVSSPLNTFDQTLRTPQARTRDWIKFAKQSKGGATR